MTVEEKKNVVVADDDDSGGSCGWLCFRPKFLQKFRTPGWVLFWLCLGSTGQGLVVNGFVNVAINSLERRFGLKSAETGLIAGSYDIAQLICLIPVSYFGGRYMASKPRWLGLGMFIMAIGSIVFCLPHFTTAPYQPTGSAGGMMNTTCPLSGDASGSCSVNGGARSHLSRYLGVFVLGQLLHGVGATPLYTLGITFLDECVKAKMSSVYVGVFYSFAIIGPGIGYLAGGAMLTYFTEFPTVDAALLGLTPRSPLWVGAWWLGFFVSFALFIIVGFPLLGFPAALPGAKAIKAAKVSETHKGGDDVSDAGFTKLRELPLAIKDLLKNLTFVFVSLAGASEGMLTASFAAFTPKLIFFQYQTSPRTGPMLVGVIAVLGGAVGVLIGGWIVKKFNLRCSQALKLCVYTAIISFIFSLSYVFYCPTIPFAGVNIGYRNTTTELGTYNIESSCNSDCNCNDQLYRPVCGRDNIRYYSPCHAGCRRSRRNGTLQEYFDCSCLSYVAVTDTNSVMASNMGGCAPSCSSANLPLFVVFGFCFILFTFVAAIPSTIATLRCVRDSQRSLSLGIQWIMVRLLGMIPGPIIMGALIDQSCILWQEKCGVRGSCRLYDNYYMAMYLLAFVMCIKALSIFFFFLSWFIYKPPPTESATVVAKEYDNPAVTDDSGKSRMRSGDLVIQNNSAMYKNSDHTYENKVSLEDEVDHL